MHDETTLEELRTWERKAVAGLLALLTTAFLAWAGVVWNSADKVMMRIDRMSDQLAADRLEQQMYRATLERRITIIEERQGAVLRRLEKNEVGE
jgi:hypothetical protein